MRVKAALEVIDRLGEVVRSTLHEKLGYKDLEAWELDIFTGIQAYQSLGLEGVDRELDTAYNITLAYMADAVIKEMKEGQTMN